MPEKTALRTNKILSSLDRELNRIYNETNERILLAIAAMLEQIYLAEKAAGARKRLRHAERHGLSDLIAIYVAYLLITNEEAISHINAIMDDVARINYAHIIDKVRAETGIDIVSAPEAYTASRYSKRAFRRAVSEARLNDAITKELRHGIRDGEDVDGLTKRVRKVANKSMTSARTAGRTEGTRIRSLARITAMKDTARRGIRWRKIWRHSDEMQIPREWHVDQDGETRELDELFTNGLLYPGEAGAPPEETVNCACYLDGEIVREGDRRA